MQFVNKQTSPDFFFRFNNKNETPDVVFTRTHKDLTKMAAEWLTKSLESCSVVAALTATVAFATAATVLGGVVQETGHPTLEDEPQFQLFAILSVIALGCSITAVVMFLSIMTSRFQEQGLQEKLARKLPDKLHYLALPIYVFTCLPATLFALAQFPLYFDLLWATIKHVPQRSYKPTA
ncbi:hypothetical protein K1719_046529 [Acacia pycnantha]|nr:hypothetical protein K1719_046529 [Acacia pycnantha]